MTIIIILHNATRVGRNPKLRADSLHAYMPLVWVTCPGSPVLSCMSWVTCPVPPVLSHLSCVAGTFEKFPDFGTCVT